MKRRLDELEVRRRALLERCDQQRVELAYHIARIGPATQLARWTHRAAQWRNGTGAASTRHYSLAIVAAIATLLTLVRSRKLISMLGWITGAVSLASRAGRILRVLAQLRALRAGFR